VKGGTWRNVYVGSYTKATNGDVHVRLSGCTVSLVTPSHNASTSGTIYLELEDVTVQNGIFCGNINSGNVYGDVNVTFGENVTFGSFYAGSQTAGNIDGTVTVTVDGADLTGMHLTGKAKNDTATNGGSILVYKSGTLGTYSDFTQFVDQSVQTLRGDMNGDGDVTDADALYLLRHTLFSDRYPIDQSGDVNGDGDVTDADALYLLRFTLFPDRYPLN